MVNEELNSTPHELKCSSPYGSNMHLKINLPIKLEESQRIMEIKVSTNIEET